MTAAVAVPAGEPLIPRPSARRVPTSGHRRGLLGGAVWLSLSAAVIVYVALLFAGYTSVVGVATVAVALAVLVPWLGRAATAVGHPDLAPVLRVGLAAKLLTTLPRFEARDDSIVYHQVGQVLADRFRALDFTVDTGRTIPGTGTIRYIVGLVEVVTLEDEMATFIAFSVLGFVGIAWFVQAFAIALPHLSPRRYAVLVVLWPSLLFWPSSIGKEAVMLLALGAASRGVALGLRGRRTALLWVVPGLGLAVLVRPHVGLIVVTAAICALVVRGRRGSRSPAQAIGRVVLVVGLVVGGSVAADGVERLLDIDGLDRSGLEAALDLAEERSAQGGSSFESARIDHIAEYPWGLVTVLFRPFPLEAPTPTMLLTAVEGAVLAGLVLAGTPRLAAAARKVGDEAYVVYGFVFVAVFVYLFSALANFGILARQRTSALPFVLALVALPTARERLLRSRRSAP